MASSLNDFLSKFNSAEGKWIDTIDPLHTFDVKFTFFPNSANKMPKEEKKGFMKNLVSGITGGVKNALNNMTGGLVGAMMNDTDVIKLKTPNAKNTVLEYITRGSMLQEADSTKASTASLVGGASKKSADPLVLDFSLYVQNASLPQITMADGGQSETMLGSFPLNGHYVKPSANNFQLNMLNTKSPIMEKVFYPWLREVTLPYWSYDSQPFTTAVVKIDFAKHADMAYYFIGCRPQQIEPLQPSNQLGEPTRLVHFIFDHMFVTSSLSNTESVKGKLMGAAGSLVSGAGSMLGL